MPFGSATFEKKFLTGAFPRSATPRTGSGRSSSNYRTAVLASTPLGYWPMADPPGTISLQELSGNNLTTTRNAGAQTYQALDPWGNPGAIYFPASTGVFMVDSQAALSFSTTNVSLEIWVKVATSVTNQENNALSVQTTSTGLSNIMTMEAFNTGASNRCGYWAPGTVNSIFAPVSSIGVTNDGGWHHWCWTRATDGTCTLYVDAVAVSTNGGNKVTAAFTANQLTIGDYRNNANAPASGAATCNATLCQAAVYSKTLTATDVTNHYNAR